MRWACESRSGRPVRGGRSSLLKRLSDQCPNGVGCLTPSRRPSRLRWNVSQDAGDPFAAHLSCCRWSSKVSAISSGTADSAVPSRIRPARSRRGWIAQKRLVRGLPLGGRGTSRASRCHVGIDALRWSLYEVPGWVSRHRSARVPDATGDCIFERIRRKPGTRCSRPRSKRMRRTD